MNISEQIPPTVEKLKRNAEQARIYASNEINRGREICENYMNRP